MSGIWAKPAILWQKMGEKFKNDDDDNNKNNNKFQLTQ